MTTGARTRDFKKRIRYYILDHSIVQYRFRRDRFRFSISLLPQRCLLTANFDSAGQLRPSMRSVMTLTRADVSWCRNPRQLQQRERSTKLSSAAPLTIQRQRVGSASIPWEGARQRFCPPCRQANRMKIAGLQFEIVLGVSIVMVLPVFGPANSNTWFPGESNRGKPVCPMRLNQSPELN